MKNLKKIKRIIETLLNFFAIISLALIISSCTRPNVVTVDGKNSEQSAPPPPPPPTPTPEPEPTPTPTPTPNPTPGICGPTNNSCLGGTLVDNEDTTSQYQWTCNGTGGAGNASCSAEKVVSSNCVQIFYDSSTDPNFKYLGRTYGLMLANLLAHFPEHQQIIGPIDAYKSGDLDKCHATFYIGAQYDKPLPQAFKDEYATTTKTVVWMGYNFWQLGSVFEETFGYSVNNGDYQFTTLSTTQTTPDGNPGYFRDVLYKGEVFEKYGKWKDSSKTTFYAAFEMTNLLKKTSDRSTVLARAKHSTTGETIPWAYKAGKKYFVTEIPFGFIHEGDRYFVFADLLFDFLEAQPKHNAKNALIRLEDIHCEVELNYLDEAVNILKKYNITPHINIIPIYKDPTPNPDYVVRMENKPTFANLIRRYKSEGTVFIWHGVTHQYNEMINPFTGISGDDYEFWNYPDSSPVAEDSPQYIVTRLNDGFNSLKKFNIYPNLWVPPHYRASALDSFIFGGVFKWNIGRSVYSDYTISGYQQPSNNVTFGSNDPNLQSNQNNYVSALYVKEKSGFTPFGQLYPYELYGDIYNQLLVPENLGNVQPELNDQVVATRSVDRILADAKRNLVLRDVWASVFYHPFLLDPALNPENQGNPQVKDLERLVKGIKDLGYNFINMDQYANSNSTRGLPRVDLESN